MQKSRIANQDIIVVKNTIISGCYYKYYRLTMLEIDFLLKKQLIKSD